MRPVCLFAFRPLEPPDSKREAFLSEADKPAKQAAQRLTSLGFESPLEHQKRVTLDFLTKRQKVNEGEAPQYYVEESHEAIIPPEEWGIVQLEMARRKALGRKYSGSSIA